MKVKQFAVAAALGRIIRGNCGVKRLAVPKRVE